MPPKQDLFHRIPEFENLKQAFRKAARGKRSKLDVAAFEFNLESELFQLQEELETQSYRPGAYTSFTIREPKRRLISKVPFRDRVVHHALCKVIEPMFERSRARRLSTPSRWPAWRISVFRIFATTAASYLAMSGATLGTRRP